MVSVTVATPFSQSLLRCLYGREAARSAPVLDDGGGAASAAATAAAPFSWSAALRFDSDSFRQLYRILQDADLGQYAGTPSVYRVSRERT